MKTKKLSDYEVLVIAKNVILTQGPQSFTLDHISKKTGLSSPALIKRFQTKNNILKLALEVSNTEFDQKFLMNQKEGLLGILSLFEWFSEAFKSEKKSEHLFLLYQDSIHPVFNKIAKKRMKQLKSFIKSKIDIAIDQKEIRRPNDINFLASNIEALLHGLAIQNIFADSRDMSIDFVRSFEEFIKPLRKTNG